MGEIKRPGQHGNGEHLLNCSVQKSCAGVSHTRFVLTKCIPGQSLCVRISWDTHRIPLAQKTYSSAPEGYTRTPVLAIHTRLCSVFGEEEPFWSKDRRFVKDLWKCLSKASLHENYNKFTRIMHDAPYSTVSLTGRSMRMLHIQVFMKTVVPLGIT